MRDQTEAAVARPPKGGSSGSLAQRRFTANRLV
jgi:hypothetical protein